MNPFEMVVAIITIVMIAAIIIKRMELGAKSSNGSPRLEEENRRLRQEMEETRKRLRVLERIVTDSGAHTASQIEALRERDRFDEEGNA